MTPQQHARVRAIFLDVVGAAEDQRSAVLAERCAQDAELRAEVERLLAHHAKETGVLLQPLESRPPEPERRYFAPGTVVAQRYRIVARLGGGGMGDVYRSEDLTLKQTVALKFLPPHLAQDAAWLERLRGEVRTARTVTHPNVCRTYDIVESEGEQFISMEYVDGEDLASLLRRIGRLPNDKALEIAHQLCSGLAAAHLAGVLHRDLKPANVMIDGRGKVRITDFGLAGSIVELRGDRRIAGTPAYMAPEQIAGLGVDERTDIYSLGLVLYELFTGKAAMNGESFVDYLRLQLSFEPPPPSEIVGDLDPDVDNVIRACITKNPTHRPQSAQAISSLLPGGDTLARALAAGDTPAPEVIAVASMPHALRANQVVAALVSSLILLALFVAVGGRGRFDFDVARMKPPAVLLERARTFAQTDAATVAADAWGYVAADDGAEALLDDAAADLHPVLAHDERNDLVFWYRTLSEKLVETAHTGRIALRDPPESKPGMRTVVLDAAGRLVAFTQYPEAGAQATSVDWPVYLAASSVSTTGLADCAPLLAIPTFADERAAWCTQSSGSSTAASRVEVAAWRGSPLLFMALESSNDVDAPRLGRTLRTALAKEIKQVLTLAAVLAAIPLARRNLQRGRGDSRMALRLATVFFAIRMTVWLLSTDHRAAVAAELHLFREGLLLGLLQALAVGMCYIALEPAARRYWPYALVSWTRLSTGRWWDAAVGQHVLIGALLGIVWAVLLAVDRFAVQALGFPLRPVIWEERFTLPLLGGRYALALAISLLGDALVYGLLILFVLALLQALLRRRLPSALLTIVIIAALFLPYGSSAATAWLVIGIGCIGTAVWAVMRYGLLTLITAIFVVGTLALFPMTVRPDVWFSDLTMFAVAVALIPLVGGFLTARRAPAMG